MKTLFNKIAKIGLALTALMWLFCLAGAVFGFSTDFMIMYIFLLWIPVFTVFAMIESITSNDSKRL